MQYISDRPSGLKALLIAVACTLFSFLIALTISNSGTKPLEDPLRLNTSGISGVQVVGNCIYYKEGASLHCVNSDGSFKWNMSVDSNAKFSVNKYGVAVWSYRKFQIVDIETGVSKISTSFDKDIVSARIGDTFAAAVLAPESSCSIVITDLQGNQIDTITGLTELTVLDYGFFENQSLFWLMTLDSTGSLPTCTIATYKPGRSETGNITDMEQVIYKVQFRQNYIYCVGTSYMRVYDYKGSELTAMRKTVYGYTLETVNDDTENPLMVFIPNHEDEEEFDIQDIRVIRGSSDTYMHFPVSCFRAIAKGNTIYGFSRDAVCVAHEGSNSIDCLKLPVPVDGLIGITDDLTAIATYGSSIYLFRLPS